MPAALKGPQSHIERLAALLAYTSETWQLAGEFDYGHNAFNTGNLFSGSGPGDAFGVSDLRYETLGRLVHGTHGYLPGMVGCDDAVPGAAEQWARGGGGFRVLRPLSHSRLRR